MSKSYVLEMMEKMRNGEVSTTSKLNLRNEKKQSRIITGKIPGLKKVKKKISRLLIIKEVAIPFNPWTGAPDETYNEDMKFRPELSFSTTALMLKNFYNDNPEVKETFMKALRIKSWDTSNTEALNQEDLEVLRIIRPTRIASPRVIGLGCKTVTNSPYVSNYEAGFDRDNEGDIVMPEGSKRDYPEILEMNRAYSSIFFEEYAAWEKDNIAESDEKKKAKRWEILGKNPISGDRSLNLAVAIEIELDNKMQPKVPLADLTAVDLKNMLVHIKVSSKIKGALEELEDADKFLHKDTNLDFLELDMIVGNEDNDAERGTNTKFTTAAEYKIKDDSSYDKFIKEVSTMLDEYGDMELPLKKSAVYKKIDETVIQRLYACLASEVKFNTIQPYLTKEILNASANILSDIYGDPIDNMTMESAMGAGKNTIVSEEQKKLLQADLTEMTKPLEDDNAVENVDLGL